MKYNPLVAPDPGKWLGSGEAERISAVVKFHQRSREHLPNVRLHAAIHVIIENQVAMGLETPVADALQRLMGEGLDRHEAVHALGSVLAAQIYTLSGGKRAEETEKYSDYFDKIRDLTAQKWFDEYGEPDS